MMELVFKVLLSPMAFGVGFSCAKTSVSDLVVQVFVERRENIDWKRNAAFASFGFGYLGIVQYSLYVPVFSRLFPNAEKFAAKSLREKAADFKGQAALAAQVFLDQCVHHPFMYFPAFYMTKEVVCLGMDASPTKVYERWSENFWPDLFALWKLWVPATAMNFAFSPMWMRIPVVASTSLIWTCILSSMRGGSDETADLPTGPAKVLDDADASHALVLDDLSTGLPENLAAHDGRVDGLDAEQSGHVWRCLVMRHRLQAISQKSLLSKHPDKPSWATTQIKNASRAAAVAESRPPKSRAMVVADVILSF